MGEYGKFLGSEDPHALGSSPLSLGNGSTTQMVQRRIAAPRIDLTGLPPFEHELDDTSRVDFDKKRQ